MTLRFRPLHGTFGAEVMGVDFSRDLDASTLAEIEAAWCRHSILLFRNVTMTPAQHVAFTRKLGPLHIMEPLEFNLPGFPEVLVVSNMERDNKPVGMKRAGWGWHSDGEDKVLPNAGSFIHALKLPPADGDTMYADTYAAFAALPADVRRRIMGRRACFPRQRFHEVYYPHLPPLTEEQKKARPDVWHPIARRHPKSGWTALYIGRWAYKIDGMPDAEAQELIDYLKDFATRPEFVYRHQWRARGAAASGERGVGEFAKPVREAENRARGATTATETGRTLRGGRLGFRSHPAPALVDT